MLFHPLFILFFTFSSMASAQHPSLLKIEKDIAIGELKAKLNAQLKESTISEFALLKKQRVLQINSKLYEVSGTTTYSSDTGLTSVGIFFGKNSSSGIATEEKLSQSIAQTIWQTSDFYSFSANPPDWLHVPSEQLVRRAKTVANFFKKISPRGSSLNLSHLSQMHTCKDVRHEVTLCLNILFIDPTPNQVPDDKNLYIIVEEYEQ